MNGRVKQTAHVIVVAALLICLSTSSALAQQATQCFSIEFFYDSSVSDAQELRTALEEFSGERTGLILHVLDVNQNEKVQQRVAEISKHFRLNEIKLPAIYGMKNVIADLQTTDQMRSRLKEILTLTAYVRNGCPHCRDAKAFLGKYGSRYPALEIVYKEVITSQAANQEMQTVVRRYQQRAASLPVIHYCNGLTIGYDRDTTTGRKILETLDYWSRACPAQKKS